MRINNLIAIAITSLALSAPAVLAQFSKSTVSSQINTQFPDQTTGQITPATTRAFLNNMLNSYQQYAGLNKQAGTTYVIQNSDYGQLVTFNNSSTVNVTLSPANSSGYTTFNFYTQNISSGNVVITPTGGSTICGNTALTLANTQNAWIISDGTNYQCQFGIAGTQLSTPLTVAQGGTNGTTASGTLVDNISGFSLTGFLLRTGSGTYTFLSQANGLTLGNITTLAANTTICNPSNTNQGPLACTAGQMSLNLCTPTRINFLTATNSTFTTPTCNGALPTFLEINMVGGGGAGGGSGSAAGTAATVGTPSCWKSSTGACTSPDFQAGGGGAGANAGITTVAAGGVASAICDLAIPGGSGTGSGSATSVNLAGAYGGNGFFGGGGAGGATAGGVAGSAAATNSGAGGGGGGGNGATPLNPGSGGAAGAYCTKVLTPANILSSYFVTVGTGGTAGGAGTNGSAGGGGANGNISIRARWQ